MSSRCPFASFLIVYFAIGLTISQVLAADNPASAPQSAAPQDSVSTETLRPKAAERAVADALYWLARHQAPQGNWSLKKYTEQCKDDSCAGVASQESLSAATALGVLPLLAAGQTQTKDGPFQKTIADGIAWLSSHQKPDGDLSAGAVSQMYSHGLATIVLCEDYGISHDKTIGAAAQKGIDFIEAAQNTKTGGWRYLSGQDGDTSVLGWQMTALKSAQLAGLTVKPATLAGAKKWLASCSAAGADVGRFSYQPESAPTAPMSAIGVLSNQFLKAGKNDPSITGGIQLLMANQPDPRQRNVYYWYFGTQAMHNMADKDWDVWHQQVTKVLIESQIHAGCASGSWDPEKPNKDAYGAYGGRIMQTSLSCLTLEVYYRYLPLFRQDKGNDFSGDAATK